MVTDKELLTFCNLTNLKMEYANLIKKEKKKDKNGNSLDEEISTNHTIYSLLDEEIKSFNSDVKKTYFQLKENQFAKDKILMILKEEKKSGNKKETIEKFENELKKLEEKEKKITKKYTSVKDNIFGTFYSKEKNKETEYFYFNETDISKGHLGKGAPYVLERYLKYKDCENKNLHKFIDEWELLQYYDNYELAKDLYESQKKKNEEAKKEAKKVNKIIKESIEKTSLKQEKEALDQLGFYCNKILENNIDEFPTRDEVLKNKAKKIQLTALKIIGNSLFKAGLTHILGSSEITSKITNKLKDSHLYIFDNMAFLELLDLGDDIINSLASKHSIDFTKLLKITARFGVEASLGYKNDLDYSTMGKNIIDRTIKEYHKNKENELLTSYDLSVFGFNQTIDLAEKSVSCLLLKKKNKNIYSLVIKNLQELGENLNDNLNSGKIPKEIFQLEIMIQQLIKKFKIPNGAELILTGVENAGKLASLYQILAKFDNKDNSQSFNLNMTCRGFFIKKPLNIGTLVDLTPRDIFMISSKNYTTNLEMISFSILGEEKLEQIPVIAEAFASLAIGVGTLAWKIAVTIFILNNTIEIISRYINQKKYEKSIEQIFHELEKNGIIGKFSKEVVKIGKITGIPRNQIEYPHFESNEILGKVLNLEKSIVINLKNDLNIQFKKFNSFAAGKLVKALNSNIPEMIEIKSLKNYLTLSFLINNLNYSTLKIVKEYIILGNKDLSDLIIYKINEDKITTLKSKVYDYKCQLNYMSGTFSSIEKVRFSPKKEYFQKNNILTKYSQMIDFNDIKVINFQSINGEAPPKIELNLEGYIAEILNFVEFDKKPSIYYEIIKTSNSKVYGENIYKLLKLFKFLQKKYEDYIQNKTIFGVGYLNKKEKKLLEKLKYSLEKKEEKENNWKVSEIEFLCGTSEETGMISTKGFNLYNQLTPEYKGSILRSIFQDRLNKNNYNELSIGLKKVENEFEDEVKLYDFNEINYKEKLLKLIKHYSRRDSIDICFPHFKLIAQHLKIEDLDRYAQIFTNEFGDKKVIIGNIENGTYKNEAFGYCLSSNDKLLGRVLEIPLQKLNEKAKEIIEEPTASPITDGVILECNCGTSPTPLKVTSQSNLSMRGKFTATEKDNIPNTNILPFGSCKNLPFNPPCPLSITGKWENTSKTFTIKGGAVLLDSSSMKCSLGGEIKPKNGVGYWKSK